MLTIVIAITFAALVLVAIEASVPKTSNEQPSAPPRRSSRPEVWRDLLKPGLYKYRGEPNWNENIDPTLELIDGAIYMVNYKSGSKFLLLDATELEECYTGEINKKFQTRVMYHGFKRKPWRSWTKAPYYRNLKPIRP